MNKHIVPSFACALPVLYAIACGSSAVPGIDPSGSSGGGGRAPARVTLTEGVGVRLADGALMTNYEGDLSFFVGRTFIFHAGRGLSLCEVGRFRSLAEVPADAPCQPDHEVGAPAGWRAWVSLGRPVNHDEVNSPARGSGLLVRDASSGASHRVWISSTALDAGGGRVTLEFEPIR